jgi:pyruvate dehydrogenase E1 component alpha subunit
MFSRALRTRSAAPALRSSAAWSRAAVATRTVTTDAASAHADKEAVPEVSGIYFVFDGYDEYEGNELELELVLWR